MNKLKVSLKILLFISFLLTGCSVEPEESACILGNLLIENSAFPNDTWEETGSRGIEDAPSRVGIDKAGTSFSTKHNGGSVQHIYRFSNEEDAYSNFEVLKHDWITLVTKGNDLVIPDELSGINLAADKYLLGCTYNEIETCLFVALYDKNVVEFMVDMPSLAYEDLVNILIEINIRMQACK